MTKTQKWFYYKDNGGFMISRLETAGVAHVKSRDGSSKVIPVIQSEVSGQGQPVGQLIVDLRQLAEEGRGPARHGWRRSNSARARQV